MSLMKIGVIEQMGKEFGVEKLSPKLTKAINKNKELSEQKINFIKIIDLVINDNQEDMFKNQIELNEIDNYLSLIAKKFNIELLNIFENESIKELIDSVYKRYDDEGRFFFINRDNYENENEGKKDSIYHKDGALHKAIYKHQKFEELIKILKNRYLN